jgi:hypothetical protein
MKYLKSYEKIFESLQDSDVKIDQLLESIGIPEQRRPEIVSWWNDNRGHIKIKFFDFNTTHPICGVFLGEDVIAVNRRLRMPMPPHFRLFIMLHESRHCDQYREGRFIDGYFDSVVNGDRETFMKAYRELEKDANDFAIDSMREIGFTREMDSEEYRLRGNEGAGNQVYAMMTKDINDMKPTDFFDLLRKQIGIK